MKYKDKPCRICKEVFTPLAPCNLYCDGCKPLAVKAYAVLKRGRVYKKWCDEQKKLGREHAIGVGKGGSNLKGEDHPQFVNGIATFLNESKRMSIGVQHCNRCNKDLTGVSSHYRCLHHIDHNRNNNVVENFELMCKSCHQIEHEVYKNFTKASQ